MKALFVAMTVAVAGLVIPTSVEARDYHHHSDRDRDGERWSGSYDGRHRRHYHRHYHGRWYVDPHHRYARPRYDRHGHLIDSHGHHVDRHGHHVR